MPSPIAQHGITLDNTFDPYVAGTTKAAATGIYENGVDICNLYANIIYGTAAAATGIRCRAALTDLNAIFAKKGTASYNDSVVIPFGNYSALSTDSHDAGSTLTFAINRDGTWSILLSALHAGSTSGAPTSGNWTSTPSAAIGDQYEFRATAAITINNNYSGDAVNPSYTASTGWLQLSTTRQLIAATDHLLGGGAGSGTVTVSGYWNIDIRKIGNAQIKTSKLNFDIEAMTS